MSLTVNDFKAFALVFTSVVFLVLCLPSADAHYCRYYRPDARNLCLAKKENKRFYCRYIKDPDQQRYCYSYMDKSPNGCDSIQDETLKEQCRGEAQSRLDEAIALQKAREAEAEAKQAAEEAAKKAAEDAAKEAAKQTPQDAVNQGAQVNGN